MKFETWKAFALPSAVWVLAQPVDRYAAGVWTECLLTGLGLVVAVRVLLRPPERYAEHALAGGLLAFLMFGQALVATLNGYTWPAFYAWLLNAALCFWFLVSNEDGWQDWTRVHVARTWTPPGRDGTWTDTGQDKDTPGHGTDKAADVPDIGRTPVPAVRTRAGHPGTQQVKGGTAVRTRPDTVSRSEDTTVRVSRMAQAGPYPVSEEPVSENWWMSL